MLVEQVLRLIKDDLALRWPKPIKAPTDVRDKSKYCRFHQDHGYNTNECKHLKEQVKSMIRQGKLQKFVRRGDYQR